MRQLLMPLSWLFDGIGRTRNWLYDHRLLRVRKLPTAVVSVGNLTVGGTGKTPITEFLVTLLKEKNLSTAVLSRGYGREETRTLRVPIHGDSAELVRQHGDEPTWIAKRHPDVPVYVGQDRYEAGLYLLERTPARVLLLDDAFQHRKVARDLNILLIDSTEDVGDFAVLPAGRGREGIYALKRASLVILNKINLAGKETLEKWREYLRRLDVPCFEFEYRYTSLLDPATGRRYSPQEVKGMRMYLFSGLAKPDLFEQQVRSQLDVQVVGHHKFADHHSYTDADMTRISHAARDCEWICTTEKDAIKLQSGWLGKILVAELGVVCPHGAREQLYEMVRAKIT